MALAVGDGDKQQMLLIPTDDDLQAAVVVAVGPGMSCDNAASVGALLPGCGCWMSVSAVAVAEGEPVS
jgi:hypothetical protein